MISIQQFQKVIVNCILHPVIAAIGIVANLFCYQIFYHYPRFWRKIRLHLIWLMLWDTVNLVASVLLFSVPEYLLHFYGRMVTSYFSFYYELFVAYELCHIAMQCSILVTLFLATERYLALCHPLFHAKWCSQKIINRMGLIIPMFSVVFTVPRVIELRIVETGQSVSTNVTFYKQGYDDQIHDNMWHRWLYQVVAQILFVNVGPTILLGYFGVAIKRGIAKNDYEHERRIHCELTSLVDAHDGNDSSPAADKLRRKRAKRANVVSLILVLKSITFHTWPAVINILDILVLHDYIMETSLSVPVMISNLLVVANSAVNFLIFFYQPSFRRAVYAFLHVE